MEIFCGFNDKNIEFTPNSITLRDVYIDRGRSFNRINKYFKIALFSIPSGKSNITQYELVNFTGEITFGTIANNGLSRTTVCRINNDLKEEKINNVYYTKFTYQEKEYYYRGSIQALTNITEGTYVDITSFLYLKKDKNLQAYNGSNKIGIFKRLPLVKYRLKERGIINPEGKFNGEITENNKALPNTMLYKSDFYFDYITFNFGQENFWKTHSMSPLFIGVLLSNTSKENGAIDCNKYLTAQDKEFALQKLFSYSEFIQRSIKSIKNNYYLSNITAKVISQTSSKSVLSFGQDFNVKSLQGLPYKNIPYAIYSNDVILLEGVNAEDNTNLKQDGHRLFTEISSNRYDLVKRRYTSNNNIVSIDNIDKTQLEYQAKYDLSEPILVEGKQQNNERSIALYVNLKGRLSTKFLRIVDGFTLDEDQLTSNTDITVSYTYIDKKNIPNEILENLYTVSGVTNIGCKNFVEETVKYENGKLISNNDLLPVDSKYYGCIYSVPKSSLQDLIENRKLTGFTELTETQVDEQSTLFKFYYPQDLMTSMAPSRPLLIDSYGKEHFVTSIKGTLFDETRALIRYVTLKPAEFLKPAQVINFYGKDFKALIGDFNYSGATFNSGTSWAYNVLFTGSTTDLYERPIKIEVIRQLADTINSRIERAFRRDTFLNKIQDVFTIQFDDYDEYVEPSNTYVKQYKIPNTTDSDYLYVSNKLKLDIPLFKYPKSVFSVGTVNYNEVYNCLFTEVSLSGANEYSNIDSGIVYIKPSINGYYYEKNNKIDYNSLSLILPDTQYNGNIQFLFSETSQKLDIDTSKDTIIQLKRPFYDNAGYDINFDILNRDNNTLIERFVRRCNIGKINYSDYATQLVNNFEFINYNDQYTDIFGIGLWDNKKQMLLSIKKIDEFKFYTNTPRYCKVIAYSGSGDTKEILEIQEKEFVINDKVAIDNKIDLYFDMECFRQSIPYFTVEAIVSDEKDNIDKLIWSGSTKIKTPIIGDESAGNITDPTSLCHFGELLTNTWNFTTYDYNTLTNLTIRNEYNKNYIIDNISTPVKENNRLIKYSDFNNVNRATNKNNQSIHYYLTSGKTSVTNFNEFKGYLTLISRYDMYYDDTTAIRQCDICAFNTKEMAIPIYDPTYENVINTIDYITGITEGKDYTLLNDYGGVYELSGYTMTKKILIGSPNTCEYSSDKGKNVLTPNLGKIVVDGYISFNLISDNLVDLNENSILNIKKGCIIEINYYDRCNNLLNDIGAMRFEMPSIDTVSSSKVSSLEANEFQLLRHTKYVEINVTPLITAETKYDYFIENLRIEVTKTPTIQIYNTAIDIDYNNYTYYYLPGVEYNYYTYEEADNSFIDKSKLLLKSKYKEINALPYYNELLEGDNVVVVDKNGNQKLKYKDIEGFDKKALKHIAEFFYGINNKKNE